MMMKNDKLFYMGTSIDERSDDESNYVELRVPRNSSSKNVATESIPLVTKWLLARIIIFKLDLYSTIKDKKNEKMKEKIKMKGKKKKMNEMKKMKENEKEKEKNECL